MKYTSLILTVLISTTLFSCKKDKTETNTNAGSNEYNPGTGWNLSWSEEFDGTSLNTSIWNYDIGTGTYGWGNAELEYHRSENVQLADGKLVITAKRENYSSSSFTSGRINTKDKYSFKYGKVVGRIKVPGGYGMWPAFWMLGSSAQAWPACGEIDIMEIKGGQEKTTYSTLHWQDNSSTHQYYGQGYSYTSDLFNDYHYYEVEWNENKIVARFDGIQYNEMNVTAAEVSELRDNSYFIILNVAVGGNFFSPAITNPANVTATFPQSMYVDWVRVYQK